MTESRFVLEAIALRRCLEATYNRMRIKLAPHILYTRHGELFVDAVTIEREGRAVGEAKLGTFKLTGLQIREVVAHPFNPQNVFDPANPKYQGVTLLAV
ncbi:hypothetical protein [Sphingomonas bacterium]|uniref:hypothetical protein n=1 Tax=Sphingomonas bacterium TaxID=1895847 RepID=UPI00157502AE|nr:hypothetical protein [Sphingomonas bacterium]